MFDVNLIVMGGVGMRHKELLQEAEADRLARYATLSRVTWVERVLAHFGDLLISTGMNLKRRREHKPVMLYGPILQVGQRLEL